MGPAKRSLEITADGYSGLAKIVVDEDRRVLIGVTFGGQDIGEMIPVGTVAVVGEFPSIGCGTPCRPIPQSARSGFAYSKRTAFNIQSKMAIRNTCNAPSPNALDNRLIRYPCL